MFVWRGGGLLLCTLLHVYFVLLLWLLDVCLGCARVCFAVIWFVRGEGLGGLGFFNMFVWCLVAYSCCLLIDLCVLLGFALILGFFRLLFLYCLYLFLNLWFVITLN